MSNRCSGSYWVPSVLVAACLLGAVGCEDDAPFEPGFQSEVVSAADVLARLDTARTYEYRFSMIEPESLLVVVARTDLPLEYAWWPLDYRCLDPLGPRLTVELQRADPRILDLDFQKGTGRLVCATMLRQYTPSG